MKAIQFKTFGGPEVLEIVELNDPHPGPGQVRIAVRAAGVNASDWKKRQGHMDQQLPQALGYEAAGIVDLMKCGLRGSPTVVKQVFAPKPREVKAEQVPTGDKSYADLSEVVMERILGLQPTLEADLLRMAAAY